MATACSVYKMLSSEVCSGCSHKPVPAILECFSSVDSLLVTSASERKCEFQEETETRLITQVLACTCGTS